MTDKNSLKSLGDIKGSVECMYIHTYCIYT